jgi:hypothetical protein
MVQSRHCRGTKVWQAFSQTSGCRSGGNADYHRIIASRPAADAPAADDGGTILVTANRRAENIQKVGTSIAVLSATELADHNVQNVYGLQYLTLLAGDTTIRQRPARLSDPRRGV